MPGTDINQRPGLARRIRLRLSTLGTLIVAVWQGPFWWLVPFVCVLAVFAVFLVVIAAFPAAAPFFYALF